MTIIAKKITVGSLNNVRRGFKGIEEQQFVARIYGSASGCTVEDGQLGSFTKFTGQFKGVNAEGEVTIAPVCYLVAPADTLLREAITAAEGKAVDFGFDFHVVPNESAVLGYEYRVKPIIEVKTSEPMLALEASFSSPPPIKAKQMALPDATKQEVPPPTEPPKEKAKAK